MCYLPAMKKRALEAGGFAALLVSTIACGASQAPSATPTHVSTIPSETRPSTPEASPTSSAPSESPGPSTPVVLLPFLTDGIVTREDVGNMLNISQTLYLSYSNFVDTGGPINAADHARKACHTQDTSYFEGLEWSNGEQRVYIQPNQAELPRGIGVNIELYHTVEGAQTQFADVRTSQRPDGFQGCVGQFVTEHEAPPLGEESWAARFSVSNSSPELPAGEATYVMFRVGRMIVGMYAAWATQDRSFDAIEFYVHQEASLIQYVLLNHALPTFPPTPTVPPNA